MAITKDRISSPQEAGPSLHDAKQLPPLLISALDYVSNRLARNKLHLSLIIVKRSVQMPDHSPKSPLRSSSPGYAVMPSPTRSLFSSASSTLSRSLIRYSSNPSSPESVSSTSPSTSLSRTQWPGLPCSPRDASATPPSPSSSCSSPSLSQCSTPTTLNPYGISLIHATTLTPKAEKILRRTISKAEKKFSIGSGWLSSLPLATELWCPATNDLIRRSLVQNSVVYTSEGLTLLELDHVYSFKCHLHTYSRTLSPADLTSSVDELRRLVLAQHGRRITKGYLMRAYDWLGVSLSALVDVNEGYKLAYGGEQRTSGIEVQDEEKKSPPPLKTNFGMAEIRRMKLSVGCYGDDSRPPSPISEVEVGESAKGVDGGIEGLREDKGPHRRGPVTPNAFEDITPVTKGEWCFLLVGDGWKEARRAAVETC